MQHEYIVGQLYAKKVINLQTLGDVVLSKTRSEARNVLIQQLTAQDQDFNSLGNLVDVLRWSATVHCLPSHDALAEELSKVLPERPFNLHPGLSLKVQISLDLLPSQTKKNSIARNTQLYTQTPSLSADLCVGREAFRMVYSDFEKHLHLTAPILQAMLSAKIISYSLYQELNSLRVLHSINCKTRFLYHLAQQNSPTLLNLSRKLKEVSVKDCLPSLTDLADKLELAIASEQNRITVGVNAQLLESSFQGCFSGQNDSLTTDSAPILSLSQSDRASDPQREGETIEYKDVTEALQVLFCKDLTPNLNQSAHCAQKVNERSALMEPHSAVASCVEPTGFLKSKTHSDLVLILWQLGGTDKDRVGLAYETLRRRRDLPLEFQIVNVLGAVYASPGKAHHFKEALKWTENSECRNPLILQCRLNYLLFLCYSGSDDDLSEHYITTAHQLSTQISPEFTTAMINMAMARKLLTKCEERETAVDCGTLKEIVRFSNKASDICEKMPEWMQPFATVVDVLKMQLDARLAHLMHKTHNESGALACASSIQSFVISLEKSEKFTAMIPRQQATYHYTKAILSTLLNENAAEARRHALIAQDLYLKVNSAEAARKVMELVESNT